MVQEDSAVLGKGGEGGGGGGVVNYPSPVGPAEKRTRQGFLTIFGLKYDA